MYLYVLAYMCNYVHICKCIHVHTCIYVCVYIYIFSIYACEFAQVCIYVKKSM